MEKWQVDYVIFAIIILCIVLVSCYASANAQDILIWLKQTMHWTLIQEGGPHVAMGNLHLLLLLQAI